MVKILVTGSEGRFAKILKKIPSKHDFIFKSKKDLNILSSKSILKNLKKFKSFIETDDNKMLDKTMNSTNYIKSVLDGIKPNKNE